MAQTPRVNPFDPQATTTTVFQSIHDALAAIPDGHTHAILLDGRWAKFGGAMAKVSFLQKAPDGWNVVIDGTYDKPHGASAGVLLAKSW